MYRNHTLWVSGNTGFRPRPGESLALSVTPKGHPTTVRIVENLWLPLPDGEAVIDWIARQD